jgi:hypothetical protein
MWELGGRFGGEINRKPRNRVQTGFEQFEPLSGVKTAEDYRPENLPLSSRFLLERSWNNDNSR